MTMWLRQSTTVIVAFGPALDKTDGVTLEVGLSSAMDHASTGIRLSKNGAVKADRSDSTAPAYDAMGDYRITLNATDTATLGTLRLIFEEAATCLPIWADFMVVPANVWDSLFGSDKLEVDLTHVGGSTTSVSALATNAAAVKVRTDRLPNVVAGGAGGVFIAGTNAATTVTTALTTTFTGNLTGNVGGSVASNTELGPSEVNAQVSAVLKTDTIADLANEAPPATPTFEEALMYVYSALRNKVTVTAGSKGFHNNAGTEIYAKALADDGTIYSEAEGV